MNEGLDGLPLPVWFGLTLVVVLAALKIGGRIGAWRRTQVDAAGLERTIGPETGSVIRTSGLLALLGLAGIRVSAQDLDPRAYANLPVGLNFAAVGYVFSGGGVAVDPTLPLDDVEIDASMLVAGYSRSLDVLGRGGRVDLAVPTASLVGTANVNGEVVDRDIRGFTDPTVRFTVGLIGSPSLTLKEYAGRKSELIVGASLRVGIPIGQYDPDRLVNLGTNRWSFKPEVGLTRTYGRWTLEVATGVTFFTTNSNFFGGSSRAQDPLYSIQGHVLYSFGWGSWLGLGATFYDGGRSSVDGITKSDRQSNSRIGLTYAIPLSKHHSVKIYGSVGATVRIGSKFETLGVIWQYRWGGGL